MDMGRIIFRFFLQEESSLRKMSNSFHFQHSNQVIFFGLVIFSWSTAGVKFPKTLRVIFWVDSFVAFYQKEYFCNVSANLCGENSFEASLQIHYNSSIFVQTIVLKHHYKYISPRTSSCCYGKYGSLLSTHAEFLRFGHLDFFSTS